MLDSRTRRLLDNSFRTRDMLANPHSKVSSRVGLLTTKSSREGLQSVLKERHVGSKRLRSWVVDPTLTWGRSPRLISTAPAGENGRAGAANISAGCRGDECSRHQGRTFSSRAGLRVSVDGWAEGGGVHCDGEMTGSWLRYGHADGKFEFPRTCPSLPEHKKSFGERSSSDKSSSASLQASSSNMSARVRARAVASRPTAARRPRNHGVTIIIDPSKKKEISDKAARLIQAALLGVHGRSTVRRLRRRRDCAATKIGRVYRGWRARVALWEARRLADEGRLRHRAVGKIRNRAAKLITIFFHDIVYRKQRVRKLYGRELQTLSTCHGLYPLSNALARKTPEAITHIQLSPSSIYHDCLLFIRCVLQIVSRAQTGSIPL